MTDYVFIGRRRHPARTVILGILTLGIYGRILVYKQVKEVDGHRALFIDLRLVAFLLWLPIIGPLAVKLKARRLMMETVSRDVTHPRVHAGWIFLAAFLPLIPAFQVLVQRHLNLYWRRQQKIQDIRHRKAEIEKLRRGRLTDEKKAQIKELEGQIQRRQDALDAEEQAARAIREAEAERRKAEQELKRFHKGPVARMKAKAKAAVAARRRRGPEEAEEEPTGGRLSALRGRLGRRRQDEKPPAGQEHEDEEEETDEGGRRPLLKRFAPRSGSGAEEEDAEAEDEEEAGQSRAEKKAAKKEAKRRAKEAKAAEKEARREAKAAEKEAKRRAKEEEKDAEDGHPSDAESPNVKASKKKARRDSQ